MASTARTHKKRKTSGPASPKRVSRTLVALTRDARIHLVQNLDAMIGSVDGNLAFTAMNTEMLKYLTRLGSRRRVADNGADVSTGAGLQDAPLRGHNVTLGGVPPHGACGRRVLHVAAAFGGRRAVVEGPRFHGFEQCEVEWRSVEEVGPPVREVAGQSRASTEAEWCSLVDVRRFCE